MTDEKVPWPPAALHENALGALYNRAYQHASCTRGDSPEEAHNEACQAVQLGFYPATDGRPARLLAELQAASEAMSQAILAEIEHPGDCVLDHDIDGACGLCRDIKLQRVGRLNDAINAFNAFKHHTIGDGLCTCTDGRCVREDAPA